MPSPAPPPPPPSAPIVVYGADGKSQTVPYDREVLVTVAARTLVVPDGGQAIAVVATQMGNALACVRAQITVDASAAVGSSISRLTGGVET